MSGVHVCPASSQHVSGTRVCPVISQHVRDVHYLFCQVYMFVVSDVHVCPASSQHVSGARVCPVFCQHVRNLHACRVSFQHDSDVYIYMFVLYVC